MLIHVELTILLRGSTNHHHSHFTDEETAGVGNSSKVTQLVSGVKFKVGLCSSKSVLPTTR
jgi:hypothetical protein